MCWDAGRTCRLGLRSEGAAGETRHRHEAGDGAEVCGKIHLHIHLPSSLCYINGGFLPPTRLQELEDQYRKEREEASNLLEQQRLVRGNMNPELHHFISRFNHSNSCLRIMRANWKLFRSKWSLGTWNLLRKRRSQKRKVIMTLNMLSENGCKRCPHR